MGTGDAGAAGRQGPKPSRWSPARAGVRPKVESLWFAGGPNHPAARSMLRDILAELAPGTVVLDIDATDPTVARRYRFPGSPTIRIEGRDVDPSFRDPGDYTPRCRIYWAAAELRRLPEHAWVLAALRKSLARGRARPLG